MTESFSTRHDADGVIREVGTCTHEGQSSRAAGAYVSDDYLVAYLGGTSGHGGEPRTGIVVMWSGEKIGTYEVVGQSRGFHGVRLYHIRITLHDGWMYHGKGLGCGMSIRARRMKGGN